MYQNLLFEFKCGIDETHHTKGRRPADRDNLGELSTFQSMPEKLVKDGRSSQWHDERNVRVDIELCPTIVTHQEIAADTVGIGLRP